MTGAAKVTLVNVALIAIAGALVFTIPVGAADQRELTPAAAYWMKRARTAEARAAAAATAATTAQAQARAARRALTTAPSSIEALQLAAITSSSDPAERRAMYQTLYRLAACESTGTTGSRLPQPPANRALHPGARNTTKEARSGEHATGLLQFLPSTYAGTPYAHVSIWSPYAQALAAAWMIRQGRISEWACAWSTR